MNHLNNDDIAGFLINTGVPDNDILSCEECVADLNRMRSQMEEVRHDLAAAAERDAIFWARQCHAIRQRINSGSGEIRLRWAACVAALVAIAAVLVVSSGPRPGEMARTARVDPDYVLMAEIQQTLARPVPNAVEPMRVLASDMDVAWRAHLQQMQSQNRSRSGERQ